MACISSQKKSMKDLILEAAFSFCAEPERTNFSMSELAAKVGVSKPAIYRHYKNKEAVNAAMEQQFFDTIGQMLLDVQKDCEKHPGEVPHFPIVEIVVLFANHPEYINFVFTKIARNDGFDERMRDTMSKKGIFILKGQHYDPSDPLYSSEENYSTFLQSFYCGTAIFLLTKIRNKFLEKGMQVPPVDEFADKVVDFITHGLKNSIQNKEKFVVADISEERFAELDKLCTIDQSQFEKEDRFFTALAAVINKFTYDGVTIERIAEEMHLAKSSLYSHFENKNEMIVSQISRELSLMQMLVLENVAESTTFSEFIYLMMKTQLEYFMFRPSIIPICGWLLLRDPGNPFFVHQDCEKIKERLTLVKTEKTVVDFGLPLSWDVFMFWIASIPIALMGHEKQKAGRDREFFEKAVRRIFCFINQGIEEKI